MKIKQAEELVGITSKNIRFYEVRKFGTPLEEIHQLFQGKMSMQECLENREQTLELEQKNVEKMRMLTGQMLGQCKSIDKLDIDYWLDEMEKMEKEGVDFVDLCKLDIHRKKKMGAIAGACVASLFMMILITIDIWGLITDPDYPIGIFLFLLILAIAVVTGTLVALTNRIKEIERGEEDEAAKY